MLAGPMNLSSLKQQAAKLLRHRFGGRTDHFAAAPGRVNLIGDHVDYNDGFVLPMAIDRHACIAAGTNASSLIRIASHAVGRDVTIDASSPLQPFQVHPKTGEDDRWANYVLGVIAGFKDRGVTVPGFDATIVSDVPLGGGLSSSAAIEVAAAMLLQGLCNTNFSKEELALISQQAEHEYAGMPCGIMDQFTSALGKEGHLLLLDCRSRKVVYTPFDEPELSALIVNTNVKHELTDGGYAARRRQCEEAAATLGIASLRDLAPSQLREAAARLDDIHFCRTRHVVTEIERTTEAAIAFEEKNWQKVGELFAASHLSLRDDYEVSCAELDWVVELCEQFNARAGSRDAGSRPPIVGARMTGGGFGGCVVALVWKDNIKEASRFIADRYREVIGREATLFATRPSDGARLLDP
jgi:galactokinase